MALRRLLIDTNAYAAVDRGNIPIIEIFKATNEIVIPFIVVAELLAGFKHGLKESRNKAQLGSFLGSHRTDVLYPDKETLEAYAVIFGELRAKGKPIPTNDLWIAALARQHTLPLCTLDAHFAVVDGLEIISV